MAGRICRDPRHCHERLRFTGNKFSRTADSPYPAFGTLKAVEISQVPINFKLLFTGSNNTFQFGHQPTVTNFSLAALLGGKKVLAHRAEASPVRMVPSRKANRQGFVGNSGKFHPSPAKISSQRSGGIP